MPALDDVSHLVALDSEDRSKSVAEARHLVRAHFLLPLLNAAYEIAMNPACKERDRLVAQKILIDFASEAQNVGSKTLSSLSPAAAKLIARYGNVPPPGQERKRIGDSNPEDYTRGDKTDDK